MDLPEFAILTKVPEDFDSLFYEIAYPETKGFYQPFASEQGISDQHRLYFHFVNYGRRIGYLKNSQEKKVVDAFFKHLFDSSQVNPAFDEKFYETMYPEAAQYYRAFCEQNQIGKRERLYQHYQTVKKRGGFRTFKNEQELAENFKLIVAPSLPLVRSPKLAVVAHAFYPEVWEDELSFEIQKIQLDFDLFVSVLNSDPILARKVKAQFPKSHIFMVENRGADIWPFLTVIRQLASQKAPYEFFLKLQTKRSSASNPLFTAYLRKGCYTNLCQNINFILTRLITLKEIGMVGAPNTRVILPRDEDTKVLNNLDQMRAALGIQDTRIDFIFGTMFVVRSNLLNRVIKSDAIHRNIFETEHRPEGTMAHAFERLFANIVRDAGQKVVLLDELL